MITYALGINMPQSSFLCHKILGGDVTPLFSSAAYFAAVLDFCFLVRSPGKSGHLILYTFVCFCDSKSHTALLLRTKGIFGLLSGPLNLQGTSPPAS